MRAIKRKGLEPLTNYVDNLWQASWYFRNNSNYSPNWSGFMQKISKGEYADQSKIRYLPIIDLNPTKEKSIYSTLLFIQEQAKKNKYCCPVLNIRQDSRDYKIKINECSLQVGSFSPVNEFFWQYRKSYGMKLQNCFKLCIVLLQLCICCQGKRM